MKPSVTPLENVAESMSGPTQPTVSTPNPLSLIDMWLSLTGSLGMEIPGGPPEISIFTSNPKPKDMGMNGITASPSSSLLPSPNLLSVIPSSPNLSPQPPSTQVQSSSVSFPLDGHLLSYNLLGH